MIFINNNYICTINHTKNKRNMKRDFRKVAPNEENETNEEIKPFDKRNIPPFAQNVPEHIINLAAICKYNAEIKRFTAIGILNYLSQTNEIVRSPKDYVKFKWDKFSVKNNGLAREYKYSEPFFLTALVAAFSSFSASAQRIIDEFCKKEMSIGINKAVVQEDVDNVIESTEKYQKEKEDK